MLEKILKLENEKLISKAGSIDEVNLGNLMNDLQDIDYADKFLSAEYKWQLYKHKILNGRDDLSKNEQSIIKDEINYDQDSLEELLKKIVALNLNFLLRPNFTIEKFIFSNELHRLSNEIKLKLNYLSGHEHLVEGLNEALADNQTIISLPEFKSMIKTIDDKFMEDLSIKDFANLLQPANDYFAAHGFKGLPLQAITVFLDDKNLADAAAEMEAIVNSNDELLSSDRIENELENILSKSGGATTTKVIDEQENIEDDISSDTREESRAVVTEDAIQEVETELEEDFEEFQSSQIDDDNSNIDPENIPIEVPVKDEVVEETSDETSDTEIDDFDALADSIMNGSDVESDEKKDEPTKTDIKQQIENPQSSVEINSMLTGIKSKIGSLDKIDEQATEPQETRSALDNLLSKINDEQQNEQNTNVDDDPAVGYSDDILNQLSDEEDKDI